MGEWFIEQKAKRSKLKQSAALAAIKERGLFDQKVEKRTLSFHADPSEGANPPPEKSLLVIHCGLEGGGKLMLGLQEVGHFSGRETKRIREYMRDHPEFGGVMPVRLEHLALDGGMEVIPAV